MRPNQYSLNLQKEKLPPEVQSSLRRIMSYVGKTAKENKWKIRAGTIALASLAGLATGGGATMVAGGSLKLVKILASAKAGALAAGATNSLMQMRTKSATKNLDQEVNKFTLDNMLSSEATLVNAKRVVVSKEQQQAAATMAMGIMAGGLAGYEIGGANAEILREMSLSQPGEHEIPVPKPEIEKPVESAVKDSVPNASTENPIAAQITPEILAGEPFKLNDLHIVNEGLNKEYGATDIKNVNLMGSFKGVDLTPEEQKMINDVVKREAAILDYRPSMSEVQFEQYLFEKMRASLGQENWWIGAQPKGVDLDLSRIDPVVKDADVHVDTEGAEASKATETLKDNNSENPAAEPEAEKNTTAVVNTVTSPEPVGGVAVETAKASDLADPVTDSADKVPVTPEPVNENKYTVQKGDTLSDIVNEHFKDQLSKAPPGEYNKVLYKVLDNVNGSESLRNAVHISDIDHVYTNEELDLTAVGKEIERVLAEQSGDAITADGMEGADLATDKGIPTEVGSDSLSPIANDSGWRGYEATPEQKFAASGNPEILPPSKVVPVEGQYFNQPAWRDYVNQHFGNEVAFDRAVTAEVGYIDSLKSNWFDSLFGVTVYDSPYDVMKNMTVEELDELREAPDGERAFCEKHHLKYETYRDWQDRVAILKANYEWREDTTWADLFKRHVAEVKAPLLNKPAN